jgi:hypothetical protein
VTLCCFISVILQGCDCFPTCKEIVSPPLPTLQLPTQWKLLCPFNQCSSEEKTSTKATWAKPFLIGWWQIQLWSFTWGLPWPITWLVSYVPVGDWFLNVQEIASVSFLNSSSQYLIHSPVLNGAEDNCCTRFLPSVTKYCQAFTSFFLMWEVRHPLQVPIQLKKEICLVCL